MSFFRCNAFGEYPLRHPQVITEKFALHWINIFTKSNVLAFQLAVSITPSFHITKSCFPSVVPVLITFNKNPVNTQTLTGFSR